MVPAALVGQLPGKFCNATSNREVVMDTKFTNSRESLDNARLADTDWAGLTLAERITLSLIHI